MNHPSLSGHTNHTNATPHCSFPSVPPFQQPPLSGSAGMSSTGNNGAYTPAPPTNPAYHSAPPTPYTNTSNAMAHDVGSMQSGRYALAKIVTRSAVSRKDIFWNCNPITFDAFKNRLIGVLQQRGVAYLFHQPFVHEYLTNNTYIDSEDCFTQYGLLPTQIRGDIVWLMGVLQTIVENPELPCIFSAEGDGLIALENMFIEYSNAGETPLVVRWTLEDDIAKQYDPTVITFNMYINAFQIAVMKYMRYNSEKCTMMTACHFYERIYNV